MKKSETSETKEVESQKRWVGILFAVIGYIIIHYLVWGISLPETTSSLLAIGFHGTMLGILIVVLVYWHGVQKAMGELTNLVNNTNEVANRALLVELKGVLDSMSLKKIPILGRLIFGANEIANQALDVANPAARNAILRAISPFNVIAITAFFSTIALWVIMGTGWDVAKGIFIVVMGVLMFCLVQSYDIFIGLFKKFKIRRSVRPLALIQAYFLNLLFIFLYIPLVGYDNHQTALFCYSWFVLIILGYAFTLQFFVKEEKTEKEKSLWFVPYSDKAGHLQVIASAVIIAGMLFPLLTSTYPIQKADNAIKIVLDKYQPAWTKISPWTTRENDHNIYYYELINNSQLVPIGIMESGIKFYVPDYNDRQLHNVEDKSRLQNVIKAVYKNKTIFVPIKDVTFVNPNIGNRLTKGSKQIDNKQIDNKTENVTEISTQSVVKPTKLTLLKKIETYTVTEKGWVDLPYYVNPGKSIKISTSSGSMFMYKSTDNTEYTLISGREIDQDKKGPHVVKKLTSGPETFVLTPI